MLIHWSHSAAQDATWEDLADLRTRFPEALPWGQANSQGEGVVRRGSPDEPMQHEEEERMAERAQETQAPGLRRILDGLAR